MPAQFAEIAPKSLLAGTVLWGVLHWGFIGPEIGNRMLRAGGHIEQCQLRVAEYMNSELQTAIAAIPKPTRDPQKEFAINQMRQSMSSPLGDLFRMTGQAGLIDNAVGTLRAQQRAAEQKYRETVGLLKAKTAKRLNRSGDYCGCVASQAVTTHAGNDFAIYSGTLTLIRGDKVKNLDTLMKRAAGDPACQKMAG
jgi:hypothetical protein